MLFVTKGFYHSTATIGHGVWVPAFAGTTEVRYVTTDASPLSVPGRGGLSRAVAPAHDRANLRPHAAAAVLLFQSGRRRQPDRRVVRQRRDLETSLDYASGVDPRFHDRLACRRPG